MLVIGDGYWDSADLRGLGLRCGDNVVVHKTCQLIDVENIDMGDDVRIDPWCVLSAAGGRISLGSNVHIGAQAYLAGKAGIEMGDFSGLSQGVRLYSASDDYTGGGLTNPTVPEDFLNVTLGAVSIGRHVIIGTGSVILPNVSIAEGSAVGAMSLVTKPLDGWGIYAGVPVRRVRDRRRDLIATYEAAYRALRS